MNTAITVTRPITVPDFPSAPDYRDLVRDFLAGRNERTRRAYAQDLEDFRTFLGAATVDTAVRLLLALGVGNGE